MSLDARFLAKEHHAIVTSTPALQDLASMSMMCSDNTGTSTTATMSIIPDQIIATGDFTKEDVISALQSYVQMQIKRTILLTELF